MLQSYLEESMLEPSAFVVAGFGKVGSGDAESPMPAVTAGSIGFTEVEIGAVIAYLQDLRWCRGYGKDSYRRGQSRRYEKSR